MAFVIDVFARRIVGWRVSSSAQRSKEAVELATLEWVAWFNNRRLLEPIGKMPPAEAEAHYHRRLAESAVMA